MQCKCKFNARKFKSNQIWNNVKCRCECVKHQIGEKEYILSPATCSCKNRKHLASIIDNSGTTCDKIIEETKTVPTNFNEKNTTCKTQNFYVLLVFLLITIAPWQY